MHFRDITSRSKMYLFLTWNEARVLAAVAIDALKIATGVTTCVGSPFYAINCTYAPSDHPRRRDHVLHDLRQRLHHPLHRPPRHPPAALPHLHRLARGHGPHTRAGRHGPQAGRRDRRQLGVWIPPLSGTYVSVGELSILRKKASERRLMLRSQGIPALPSLVKCVDAREGGYVFPIAG